MQGLVQGKSALVTGGAIVNMASGAGLVPVPGLVHYCASKHGLLGLTETAMLVDGVAVAR